MPRARIVAPAPGAVKRDPTGAAGFSLPARGGVLYDPALDRKAHTSMIEGQRILLTGGAGFIGSNSVLNDGETRNTLVLYLGNPSLKKLSLQVGELQVRPRLSIRFDCGQLEEADEPWALAHADEVAGIEIAPQGEDSKGWVVHRSEQGETPTWVLQPPEKE